MNIDMKIAAFDDIGYQGRPEELGQAYRETYGYLEKLVKAEGYTVIHESQVTPLEPPSGVVEGHEERYLVDYITSHQSEIPYKSVPIVGVSQNTICGSCSMAFGSPTDTKYGDFPVELQNDITIEVAGNSIPEDLAFSGL